MLGRHGVFPAVPLAVSLGDVGALGVAGDPDQVASLCRWLAVQLAALHASEDLSLAVASTDRDAWAWIDLMPHPSRRPAPLPAGPAWHLSRAGVHA